jgi:hypothetical protein
MSRPRLMLALVLVSLGACGRDPLESGDGGTASGGRVGGGGIPGSGGIAGGGGSGGAVVSSTPFTTGAYCQRESDWRLRCKLEPDGGRCPIDAACYAKIFRREAQAGLADCLATRACTDNDDGCFAKAAAPYVKAAAFLRVRDACTNKVLVCGGTAGDVRDSCPDQLALASDEFIDSLQPCVAGPCNTLQACLTKVLGASGCQ